MRALLLLTLLAAWSTPVWAHGGTIILPPPKPPPPPPSMKGPPTGTVPPGTRPPSDPSPEPKPPPPPPDQTPPDAHETPPADPPPGDTGPKPDPDPRPGRPVVRTRRGVARSDQGWRIWWELNRTHLVGLRHLLHDRGPITGKKAPPGPPDPLGGYRPAVLATMRSIAGGNGERLVRASCILALGRMGGDEDARLFLGLLADARQPSDVHEAAALALGLLPPLREDATRNAVRRAFERLFAGTLRLPSRARELAVVSVGLRARDDRTLVMMLAARTVGGVRSSDEGAALALACGLAGDRMLFPELREAALRGRLGGHVLNDVGRSHVVHALGLLGEPAAASDLLRLVHSRRAGLHTKRSAVLALGRLLKDEALAPATRRYIGKALVPLCTKNGDVVLRGFAMLGDAALALGMLGRRSTAPLLVEQLARTDSGLQQGRIMLALGHLGHGRATEPLLRLLENDKTHSTVREFAAVALGLMGDSRETDTLFSLDAGFNYFATTTTTHELIRLY